MESTKITASQGMVALPEHVVAAEVRRGINITAPVMLPVIGQDVSAEAAAKEEKKKDEVENDIAAANETMRTLNSKLSFRADERSRSGIAVEVVDRETGDVIKQIPSEEMLTILARIRDAVGVLVDSNA